jgi:hypothetical protein
MSFLHTLTAEERSVLQEMPDIKEFGNTHPGKKKTELYKGILSKIPKNVKVKVMDVTKLPGDNNQSMSEFLNGIGRARAELVLEETSKILMDDDPIDTVSQRAEFEEAVNKRFSTEIFKELEKKHRNMDYLVELMTALCMKE